MRKLLLLVLGFAAVVACGTSDGLSQADVDASVEAAVQATEAARPTATIGPTATSAPAPTAVPANTPVPAEPTVASTPTPTPTKTPTPLPTATSTPISLTAQEISARHRTSVVQIKSDGSSGSGFIVDVSVEEQATYIVTADHVVADSQEITVILIDGTEIAATLLGRGFGRDLAMLRTEWTNSEPVVIGSPSPADVGSTIIRMGYGATGELSVASGVISAVTSNQRFGTELIQTDAAVNPGDSGGPIFSDSGEVIGVISSKLVGTGIEGVGFAISTNELLDIRDQLFASEIVCQPDFARPEVRTSTFRHSVFGYEIGTVGWEFVQADGGTAFGEVASGGIEAWRGSRVRTLAVIFDPVPKGNYVSASQVLTDRFEAFAGVDDAEDFFTTVSPVCISGTQGVEATFNISWVGSAGKADERTERWVSFISGGNVYLLRASAWFDKFAENEAKLDTILYTLEP